MGGQPQIHLDPFAIGILVASLHGILLATAVLVRRTGQARQRYLLAALLICGAVSCSGTLLYHAKFFLRFPHLAETYIPLVYLMGPLLFFYVRSVTQPKRSLHGAQLLHALPALAYALYLVPFFVKPASQKIVILNKAYDVMPLEWRITTGFLMIQMPVYLALAFISIRKWAKNPETESPKHRQTEQIWLAAFIAIYGIAWVVMAVRYLTAFQVETMFWGPLCISIGVYGIGYLGFFRLPHSQAINGTAATPLAPPMEAPNGEKYEKSPLSGDQIAIMAERIQNKVIQSALFQDPNLTLAKLAGEVGLRRHYLSQILNTHFGENFFDFVNRHRIEFAKGILADSEQSHLKNLEIALTSGFNSASTFYAAFKKQTGITPTAFRQERLESLTAPFHNP